SRSRTVAEAAVRSGSPGRPGIDRAGAEDCPGRSAAGDEAGPNDATAGPCFGSRDDRTGADAVGSGLFVGAHRTRAGASAARFESAAASQGDVVDRAPRPESAIRRRTDAGGR